MCVLRCHILMFSFFVFRLSLFHFTVHTRRREERGKCELKMKKLYFVY